MQINGVEILDTFAEAFPMTATRVVVTAHNAYWVRQAAESMTGFATSVIGCGCEAAIERELDPEETPDGRVGLSILLFAVSGKELQKQLVRRVGQCILTCPSTSVFAGMHGEKSVPLGDHLRYFGDGFQQSKWIAGRRFWRVPVMDGEFVCEGQTARQSAVGGGNFLLLADSLEGALEVCRFSVAAMRKIAGVILPFPGGVTRSGSKVGSKYRGLVASTNELYCPTLRSITNSALPSGITTALEIVIDGLGENDVSLAMRTGIQAACQKGNSFGLKAISAGNYGGKLGPFHFHLQKILK
jgi:formylmethanofuran--tetrahydromethanopterin N-formyltransferase